MSALLLLALLPSAPVADIKLPPGFSAHLYSDRALANDIYTMTIDARGHVFVAGRGYVRELIDDDGDGAADRAVNRIENLKDGPMGLLAEGDWLYVVADGGLKRYRMSGEKAPPETIYAVKTGGEHEAHAVRRGPDGWLYLMCGNMSGVKKEHLDAVRSPVPSPIAGSLLRISPDFKTIEAVADGFRNAYDFDFNPNGEPFTFDSDNERCIGLPWYEPCRFYHVISGGNYGWRSPQLSQTWRKPPYFADVVPPIGTTGRGSPTGVASYRNTHFPERFRGNFFIADWTFGKVWFVPLERKHSTYSGKPEVFLEAVGESGFAPTALAVHPKTGELFVSIGGRGTRGAVYRIRHDRGGAATELPIAKRSLEWSEAAGKQWLKEAADGDARIRRQALEQILRWRGKIGGGPFLDDAVKPNLSHDDPLVRAAAARLAVRAGLPLNGLANTRSRLAVALETAGEFPDLALRDALNAIDAPATTFEELLVASRIIQLAYGDLSDPTQNGTVAEGYSFRRPVPAASAERIIVTLHLCLERLPKTTPPDVFREFSRIAGAIGSIDPPTHREQGLILKRAIAVLGSKSAADDLHLAAVASRMSPSTLSDSRSTLANALLRVRRASAQKGATDRNWPLRFDELCADLVPERLAGAFDHKKFTLPEDMPFVRHLKMSPKQRAELILYYDDRKNFTWTPEMVRIFSVLPDAEVRPILTRLWKEGGLEDAILPVHARSPVPEDAPKFIYGLRSAKPEVVKLSASTLLTVDPANDQADVMAAILALRKHSEDKGARESLLALLKKRTGQEFPDAKSWAAWFTKVHPKLAGKLNAADGFDLAAWKKRESDIPWAAGDAMRGRAVFAKATCAACHDGGGAIGPSLAGVSKRFSRDDLLTAILQPSRDVASRYRPTRIVTRDETVHIGMIVYEAVSGVILQTGPDAVVRIAGDQIESQKLLDSSLMPAGLIEKLTNPEIADLIEYLRSG